MMDGVIKVSLACSLWSDSYDETGTLLSRVPATCAQNHMENRYIDKSKRKSLCPEGAPSYIIVTVCGPKMPYASMRHI